MESKICTHTQAHSRKDFISEKESTIFDALISVKENADLQSCKHSTIRK